MRTITIFGGSGFVGRYIVQKFAERGDAIRVAVRNPIAANSLKPLGEVGQITPVQASLLSEKQIQKAVMGADIVINLVGILFEKGNQTFESIHVEGAKRIAKAARDQGVERLLHMSALGADLTSRSVYAKTKAEGEKAVKKHFPEVTIFRPSVIFGAEDAFFNRFAEMARFFPALPLIGGGVTRFQPIYVVDVAECFCKASLRDASKGELFELGGPAVYTFKEIMEYLLKTIHRKRLLIPMPYSLAKAIGAFAQFLPKPPLTPDQVELLKKDSVVSPDALTIGNLDIRPHAMEAIVPEYLAHYLSKGLI